VAEPGVKTIDDFGLTREKLRLAQEIPIDLRWLAEFLSGHFAGGEKADQS